DRSRGRGPSLPPAALPANATNRAPHPGDTGRSPGPASPRSPDQPGSTGSGYRADAAVVAEALDLFRHGGLLGPLEQLDRMTRHDRRYSVLVHELRVAIPTQQHAKIIEPGDHTLELDAVHQKYGERSFVFSDVIEESVLKVL